MKNVGVAVGEGVVSEALTEGYQQYQEAKIQGKDATPAEIYEAAVIGGASGGGLSGGGRAFVEAAKATPEHQAEREQNAEQMAKHLKAIQTGDVSSYLDPKSKDYSPSRALEALFGNSQLSESDEQKQTNLKKADEILTSLQGRRDAAAAKLMGTDEKQARVEELKAKAAQYEQTDPELAQMYREELAATEEDLKKVVDPKVDKTARAELVRLDEELAKAREKRMALSDLTSSQINVDEAVATLQDPTKATDHPVMAQKVVTLAMTAPERVDPEVAKKLADDTANGLSDQQRSYLREFSAARVAANKVMKLDGVREEIIRGDIKRGNVGVEQYRSGITSAVSSGNRVEAYRQLTALQRFARSHTGKAEAAQQAFERGFGTQIQRTKSGEWFVAEPSQNLSKQDLDKNGGLAIKSEKLVKAIGAEAEYIASNLREMRSAYDMTFRSTSQGHRTDRNFTHHPHHRHPDGSYRCPEHGTSRTARRIATRVSSCSNRRFSWNCPERNNDRDEYRTRRRHRSR
jgi:hypothetical protein